MSELKKDSEIGEANNVSTTLGEGRRQYYSIRQYVTKLDQFLYLLKLDHIIFPPHAMKENKRDFQASLNRAKRSVNNLKNSLFRLAPNNLKPKGYRIAAKYRRKKEANLPPLEQGNDVIKKVRTFNDDSETEIIDIADEIVPEERSNSMNNSLTDAIEVSKAAKSLLAMRNSRNTTEINVKRPDVMVQRPNILRLTVPRSSSIDVTKEITLTSDPTRKFRFVKEINLKLPEANTEVTNTPLHTSDLIGAANEKDTPVLELNGILYTVREVDFEEIILLDSTN